MDELFNVGRSSLNEEGLSQVAGGRKQEEKQECEKKQKQKHLPKRNNFMCLCVCTACTTRVNTCTHINLEAGRSQTSFLRYHTPQVPQRSACLHLPTAEIINKCHTWLRRGFLGSNSGPHFNQLSKLPSPKASFILISLRDIPAQIGKV